MKKHDYRKIGIAAEAIILVSVVNLIAPFVMIYHAAAF